MIMMSINSQLQQASPATQGCLYCRYWMGTELEQMHPNVWDECRDQTYEVIRTGRFTPMRSAGGNGSTSRPAKPEAIYPGPSTSSAPSQQWMQLQQPQQLLQQLQLKLLLAAAKLQQPLPPHVSASVFRLPDLPGSNRIESLLLGPG